MLNQFFKNGINLGGYLSQYDIIIDASSKEQMKKHLDTFITEDNIRQIASWHYDHVRIPLDGCLFFDRDSKCLKEEPMKYLDQCLSYCSQNGLNVILDLHYIWGHAYGQMDRPTALMKDKELRSYFICFWVRMAEHYHGYKGATLLFELFNEMCDATGYRWNSLYKETVEAIRKIDPERMILIGTNYVNSVGYLDRLDLLDDENVFYNFHYYEPNVFTHQKAHFSEEFRAYSKSIAYPDDISDYIHFLEEHEQFAAEHPLMNRKTLQNDHDLMLSLMKPASDFTEYSGHEAFCSEFGVIDTTEEKEAVKWMKDFMEICESYGIGHSMWNYKCLDFELVNENNEIVRPEIVKFLTEYNRNSSKVKK